MQVNTKGIVLGHIKYKESSIIVRILTKDYGKLSFIVHGVRSSKKRISKAAFFLPLTRLDLDIYYQERKNIQRINDSRIIVPSHSIPFEPKKTAIAFFATEFLDKVIVEGFSDENIYELVESFVANLDQSGTGYENLHIRLLIELAKVLGIGLENSYLSLEITEDQKSMVRQMITEDMNSRIILTNTDRRDLLAALLNYFRFHIDSLTTLQSIDVLKVVLG